MRLRARARPSVEKRKKGHNKFEQKKHSKKTCSMVTAFPKRLHFSCPRRQASVDRRFRWIVEHGVDIPKFLALWTDVWLVWRVFRKSPDLWGSRTKCGAGRPPKSLLPGRREFGDRQPLRLGTGAHRSGTPERIGVGARVAPRRKFCPRSTARIFFGFEFFTHVPLRGGF